jgi:hypothetical protein
VKLNLFTHDSLHSERNVRFGLDQAWAAAASAAYTITSQPSVSSQTVINYPGGFTGATSSSSGGSGAIWLQNAAVLSGSYVQISSGTLHSANNAWYKTRVNVQAFTTSFTWNAICPANPPPDGCGDGMGFEIISDPNSSSASYNHSGNSGSNFSWDVGCNGETGTSGCTPIKDRRRVGKTCTLLLATAGGRTSDATAIRGDAGQDRSTPGTDGIDNVGRGHHQNRSHQGAGGMCYKSGL